MKFQRRVVYSLAFALLFFFSSLFINIVPCKTASDIPLPEYEWNLCSLNPDITGMGILKNYYGATPSLKQAYFLSIFTSFIFLMIMFHFFRDKHK